MADDPFDPFVITAEQSAVPFAPAAIPSALAASTVEQTIVMEGSSAPPSSLRHSSTKHPWGFDLTVLGSNRVARTTIAVLVTLTAAQLALLPLAAATRDASCASAGIAILLAMPVWMTWVWARARDDLALGLTHFTARSRSVGGMRCSELDATTIHGFGYQRHPTRPWRYQLVVVFRAGWTTRIDLACRRRDEVRYIARRLNAELARLQPHMRASTETR